MSAPPPLPTKDPFYVVKEKAQEVASTLQKNYHAWQDMLENTNTASNSEFASLTKEVKIGIQTVRAYVRDLEKTITAVERNRHKYSAIQDSELEARKKFVNDTTLAVNQIEDALSSVNTKRKLEKDQKEALFKHHSLTAQEKEKKTENQSYVDGHQQQQQLMEEKQDEVLDDITEALGRLGDVAGTINRELKVHDALLEEVTDDTEEATTAMQKALKQMDTLLGQSDKGRICCIVILIIVVVALLVALFY